MRILTLNRMIIMSSALKNSNSAIQTKALPVGGRMLALEPRYVFDAAIATEFHDLTSAGPMIHAVDAGESDVGASVVAASRDLVAFEARDVSATFHRDAPVDRSIELVVNAHNLAPSNHEIAFIDSRLADLGTLVNSVPEGTRIVLIDTSRDGVAQMVDALQGEQGITGIHILSHGSDGHIQLGNSSLDEASMSTIYRSALSSIHGNLAAGADILVYGCDFGAGTTGARAASLLADLTGADVASSNDLTGGVQGADWDLENSTGSIESRTIAATDWHHDLLDINGADGSTTTVRNTAVSGNLMAQITAANPTAPVTFTAATFDTAHGSVTIMINGDYTYTPNTGFLGTDSFVFEGSATDPTDGVTQTATAIETITINPDPGYVITATGETNVVGYQRSFSGTVGDNVTASLRGGPITTYSWSSGPSHGTIVFDTTTGAYTYTPNAGFSGQDSFSFSADDASPDSDAASATVTLNVSPPPLVSYDYDSYGVIGAAVTVRPWVTEADSAATLSYSYGSSPNGTLSGDGNGNFTFTPNAGFSGDTSATYTVTDTNGYVSTSTLYFHYSASGVAPLGAWPDTYNIRQGDTAYQGVWYWETNTNGIAPIYSISFDTMPTHGTISNFNSATGSYQYIADPGYLGPDSFAFTVRDQYGQSASSVENINVVPPDMSVTASVRFAPIGAAVAGNLSAETSESAGNTNEVYSINGTVLTNGATIATAHGVATITNAATGAYSWQPNSGFSGVEVINWSVKNVWGPGPSDFYEVERSTDTIVSPNRIFAGHRTYVIPENTTRTGTVTEFSGSPNGTPAYTPTFPAGHGTAVVNADGSYSYTPANGYHGLDKFGYKVANGLGNTATGYVTIYIAGPMVPGNDAPTVIAIPDRVNLDSSSPSVGVATYFTDPNNDSLTFFADGLPPGLTMDAGGNISGTVDTSASQGADFADGRYTVTVFADDGKGGVAQQTFEWVITNPAPVANPITVYTLFNTARVVDLIGVSGTPGADSDPDGDAISVVPSSVSVNSAQGTVALNGTNWVFTPANGFTGTAQISYTITDADGATASSTHDVIVGPSAVNDRYTTQLDTPLTTGNAARGDTYLPGSTFAVNTPPTHGTLNFNTTTGGYTYTPTTGFTGSDSFTYTITDPNNQTATATDTIFINTRPALVDSDTAAGTPFINPGDSSNLIVPAVDNVPVSLPLATYFTDVNGDPVTITPTGLPTWLTYTASTQTLSGTPPADNNGDVVINVTVTDNHGGSYLATITIQPVNPPLVANSETVYTPFNTARTVDLMGNDSNPDRDTLTVTSATVSAAQGTVAFDGTNWVFTPATGFTGNAQINYTITDVDGATASSTHNVIVGPSAINDAYATQLNTPVSGNAALADTYLPNSAFAVATGPMAGASVVMQGNGSYVYTPAPGFYGVDTFTYTVTDPNGQVATATDTITINVAPALVDPSPVVGTPFVNPIDPANLIVPAVDNVLVTLPLGTYFTDGNGDPMTITPTGLPTWLTYIPGTQTLTGTPPADNNGPVTIPVTVTDGHGGTFTGTVTIQPVNPGPVANTDSVATPLNTPVTVDLLVNDRDPDGDPLTVTTATVPAAQGTVALVNGNWVFTPVNGFTGTATISYTITDIDGATTSSTHDVYVGGAAVNDAYATQVNTPVDGNAAAGDTYTPGATFVVLTGPSNGSVIMQPNGMYTYTPRPGYTGVDTFTYRLTDTNGQTATATDTITINAPPALTDPSPVAGTPFIDPGNAANLIVPAVDNIAVSLPIAQYYVDPNGDPMVLNPNMTGQPTWLVYNSATQTFTGTPPRDNAGADIVIPVTVTDNRGGTFISSVTFRVTNPGPMANTDSVITSVNTPVTVNLLANDTDPDNDALSVVGTPTVANPAQGTVALVNGNWVFTPTTGFTGVATINYTIQDIDGATSSSTHDVTVVPLAAVDDNYTTAFRTPVDGSAANGDTFPAGSNFSTSTLPTHGTVVFRADGTYTYTPAATFAGTDSFRYIVTDPRGQQVMATETIIVTPPTLTATDDSYTTPFRTAVQGNAATGDVFATGSTFASTSQPASGTVVMAPNGTYTYTPPANFAGTVTFTYRITDPTGATVAAVETIVVAPPQLIAVNDAYTTGFGQALNGNAAAGDTFATGSRFTTATPPSSGTVVMNPNGTFRYVPRAGFTGVDTFTYTVTDPTGRTVTATETITITPRAPLHRCLTTFGRVPGFTPRRR
jgi:large repetitive protein